MAERCQQCNAEFGPSDAYCTVCGTSRPRRVEPQEAPLNAATGHAGWPDPPDTAEHRKPSISPAPATSAASPENNDFIPLVLPPAHSYRARDRRAIATVLVGVLLLGVLAVLTWYLVTDDGDAGDGDAALVAGSATSALMLGTPEARAEATEVDVVAGNNADFGAATPTSTLPVILPPGADASLAQTATESPTPATSTPVSVLSPVTIVPTPTSEPPTDTPAPLVSGEVLSTRAAGSLSTIVTGIEVPTTPPATAPAGPVVASSPTPPPPTSTPGTLPQGDGTGGPPQST